MLIVIQVVKRLFKVDFQTTASAKIDYPNLLVASQKMTQEDP